jgi:hypothetical protein
MQITSRVRRSPIVRLGAASARPCGKDANLFMGVDAIQLCFECVEWRVIFGGKWTTDGRHSMFVYGVGRAGQFV